MSESILDRALKLMHQGEAWAAEELLSDAAREARDEFGAESAEYAAAMFERSHVYVGLGDLRRAAAVLREACAIRVDNEEAERNRLTFGMNLGEVLMRLGELDEAIEVLRAGLTDREKLYGEGHPGVAFGVEPLADVLRAAGRFDEAFEQIERAVQILRADHHPQLAPVLILRAAIKLAADDDPFAGQADLIEELSDGDFDELVESALKREDLEEPALFLKLALEVEDLVKLRRGYEDPWLASINAAVANAARLLGEHGIRIEALEYLEGALRAEGSVESRVAIMQGLALAHDEAGDPIQAEKSYLEAAELARGGENSAQLAEVLRNYGLFCSQLDRQEDADRLLREGLRAGLTAEEPQEAARSRVALGVFLQHAGEEEEAQDLLEQALAVLDPESPEVLYAQSHLEAITNGTPCGCGDINAILAKTLREMVEPHLPEGLLAAIEVELKEDGPAIQVGLTRAPTDEEQALLQRLLEEANRDLRQRILEQGHV